MSHNDDPTIRTTDEPDEPRSAPPEGGGPEAPASPTRRAPADTGGRGAPRRPGRARPPRDLADAPFEALVREQIRRLDPDPGRQGLDETPERVHEALERFTRGHDMSLADIFDEAVVNEDRDSMVLVKNVELYSLCEHHMLPFYGRAHIAYLPDGRMLRSSELPRVVEVFARRLQLQERLTEQIARAVEDGLRPMGVGVVVEAYHLCMMMRGVEKQNSKTVTSAVRGTFLSDPRTREEFLRLVRASHDPR